MSKTKPKLIIIDGNALIHRSFHALPPTMRTKNGQIVNAVYGFTSFLLKAMNEFHPEYVILTLDKKGPTFRHEEYADYKAKRIKAPDELYEQMPLVKEVADAFKIPIFELAGFEADDLIGTICRQTEAEKNLDKIIITGDMDTLQLIDERTKVYTMSRGLTDSVLYGPEQVKERYGLRPDQIIDYKALRGDPSDNIPGVKGIGEKTASELLIQFKDLDGVYRATEKNSAKIPPRIKEKLLASRADAYLSQKLATINNQAPISFKLASVEFADFDLEKVVEVFSHLEFKSLLNKVKELRDILSRHNEPAGEKKFIRNAQDFKYQLIDDEKKFGAFLKKLEKQKRFSFDTETSGLDPMDSRLLGVSFSWNPGEAFFVVPTNGRLAALKPILEDGKIKKYGHNLKFDWRVLKNQGIETKGLAGDSMIASYLLHPGYRQHDLDSLAFTELGFEKISKKNLQAGQGQLTINFQEIDPERLSTYSCEDADFTNRLMLLLATQLKKEGLWKLFDTIEMPLIPILGTMENNGIKFDPRILKKLDEEITEKLQRLEQEIFRVAGEEFNINSTKQLREILFVKLEIPTDSLRKTKTGFSTAEEELTKLQDFHPIIPKLQSYRELNKLQTTYINALPGLINQATGRIHTNFNQTITATGRLSSTEPNLQNIPTRTEEGQRIRQAFIASPGYQLVSFDYSQIELRLAAHISGDQNMIAAFRGQEDIHTATAAQINGVGLEKVTKKMRREAKAINFGILYGQGPHGLSQSAGIPYSQAQDFIKKYWSAYPRIKKMVDSSIKEAENKGYAITMFGRKRPLPEILSNIPAVRKGAQRMAINTPIQGTAADLIKLAMIKIGSILAGKEDEIKMLLQVHDELIFEIRQDKIETYFPKIKKIMENVIELKVPIIVEASYGNNWGELK